LIKADEAAEEIQRRYVPRASIYRRETPRPADDMSPYEISEDDKDLVPFTVQMFHQYISLRFIDSPEYITDTCSICMDKFADTAALCDMSKKDIQSFVDLEVADRPSHPNTITTQAHLKLLMRLPCGHVGHYRCMAVWLVENGLCPLCRKWIFLEYPAAD